ncbi:MAG: hypothetical protein P8X39_05740 [Desulfofustis sp.]
MGGLSHYLEDEGVATTQISLIKEHSLTIKPPRALWVSFPLGRPLGIPNDSAFQKDVLKHALNLLNEQRGPVLADYPGDAEAGRPEASLPACPVDFSSRSTELSSLDRLLQRFQAEFNGMHTWYTISCDKRGRTVSGVSGLSFDEIIALYNDFLVDNEAALKTFRPHLADALRLACEDLKSCYFEALSSQPGQPTDAATLADWFWGETYAAAVINEIRKKCIDDGSEAMALAGTLLLIPRSQMHRFERRR